MAYRDEIKLAIEMWQEIREKIAKYGCVYDSSSIIHTKGTFCLVHNLQWRHSCVLCTYYTCSSNQGLSMHPCPLGNCNSIHAAYYRAGSADVFKENRMRACDEIIEVLKNEYNR